MNILAVDTGSEHGSAVVRMDGAVVAQVRPEASLHYSEHLFESIDALLCQAGIPLDDIDLFAAVRGPGSFTGLRVGLAAMDGFAFARQKKTAGVSALAALAWQVGAVNGSIVPILDARRGEIYGAVYERRGEELVEVTPPAVLQPAEWLRTLSGDAKYFCGPGAEIHRNPIETREQWTVVQVSPYLAATIAEMAGRGHGEPLEPLYIRRTAAEIRRMKAQS